MAAKVRRWIVSDTEPEMLSALYEAMMSPPGWPRPTRSSGPSPRAAGDSSRRSIGRTVLPVILRVDTRWTHRSQGDP
jgi:hypothetical protein